MRRRFVPNQLRCRFVPNRNGCRVECPTLLAFQAQGGENPGAISPRVNSDTIRLLIDALTDRVPVNDDHAVVILAIEKGGADPAQVELALQRQVQSRANPRMDENLIAETQGIHKGGNELAVLVRDRIPYNGKRLSFAHPGQ